MVSLAQASAGARLTIGRAWGLLFQNLRGGSTPGLTYLGSQGNNYAYNSVTYAENEERSPWVPFQVQHASKPDESDRYLVSRLWRGHAAVQDVAV